MTVKTPSKTAEESSQEKGGVCVSLARSGKKVGLVHSQVLRIREEDSLIGEENRKEAPFPGDYNRQGILKVSRQKAEGEAWDFVFVATRPVLRSSPLCGKPTANNLS